MNDMLRFFLHKFVIVYFDNIFIYNKNNEKYFEHVRFMIKTFCKNNYYAKLLNFFLKHIKFCDYIIDDEKIRMNKKNLNTLKIDHRCKQCIMFDRF